MNLREELARSIKGDVSDDLKMRTQFSRDTSIFERIPAIVVFPKDAEDVAAIVRFVNAAKAKGQNVSIAARAAGTDTTGGSLTDSISMVFTKYMSHGGEIGEDSASAEPGMYWRDFEKATLAKRGMLMPSYPVSRGLCAVGGVVGNNAGGELTLKYGKTNRYVRALDVVLSDGTCTTFKPITIFELKKKEAQQDLEGKIYREVHTLLASHEADIAAARPPVTKNSAGYALWDVLDKRRGTFDLTQLICGSQGTLALMTKVTLGLVKTKEHRAMLVVFLSDLGILPEVVHRVLKFGPESFESYDKHTFSLAIRFLPQLLAQMGVRRMLALGLALIPEVFLVMTGGVPALVLMAEFAEDTAEEALYKAEQACAALHGLAVRTQIEKTEVQAAKYWTIRRESFNLLRKHMPGMSAAPFIDDLVVNPDVYPQFLPELEAILSQYHFIFTIAGHIGDGNFHIYPFIDMTSAKNRELILEISGKVYGLVSKYKGSVTGEHSDGIIRTPYLPLMYGEKMCALFAEVKKIFDPHNIFNPGKKVGGTIDDVRRSMITHS